MSGNESSAVRAPLKPALRWGLGPAAVLVAEGVRLVLGPVLSGAAPLFLFILAVLPAARFGGLAAGFSATILGAVIGVFREEAGALSQPEFRESLLLFIIAGGAISWLSGRLQSAVDRAADAAEQRRVVAEAVPQLLWTSDPEGHCEFVNDRWVEFTGVPAAARSRWFDHVHPDDRAEVLRNWSAAVSHGAAFALEVRIRRRDGAWRWCELRCLPLGESRGRTAGWLGCADDIDDARRMREALRVEQERLTRIVATAPGVICSFRLRPDGSSCFPYMSPRIEELCGLRPSDLADDAGPIFERIHPDDLGGVHASIAESTHNMLPWRAEFRLRHPDRGDIWVEGHSQPTEQPGGSIEWHGFLADISARRRMEQALRERTAELEEFTRTLDLAHAFVRTMDGAISYWSHGAAAMYGWSREEAAGRNSHELLNTQFPSPLSEIQAQLLASGRWEGELCHYRRDGAAVYAASHWAVHYDALGQPISIVEVNNDITELKRLERNLRASEETLELAQAAAGIASWDWHIAAGETFCSEHYGALYGLARSDHAPGSEEWIQLIHPDDREEVRQAMHNALQGRRSYDTEFRVLTPAGEVRWLMAKGQVHRDAAGNAVRMVGVNLDITERKNAAEQLRALSASLISAQEEERRRISRELHDDLVQRLAMTAIDLGKAIVSEPPSPGPLRQELRLLQRRVVEAAELTRHIAHEMHPFILDDLGIETALRSLCADVSRRDELAIEFSSGALPPFIGREAASCLYAVAREALSNVSRHARASHIDVWLGASARGIRLTIADDGVGLSTGAAGGGVGLGIVNMRERVRWAKGSFSLESQPGGGACVTVDIPVSEDIREAHAHSAG